MQRWVSASGLALMVLGVAVGGCQNKSVPTIAASAPAAATVALPSPPPWPKPVKQKENVLQAGLDAASHEMLDYHTHTQLDVFYNGALVEVPGDVGIGEGFISPLHTHDASGKLHVEAAKAMRITLGQFFVQWGVSMQGAQVYDNGKPVANGWDLELVDRHRIVVVYGTAPAVIPSEPPNW